MMKSLLAPWQCHIHHDIDITYSFIHAIYYSEHALLVITENMVCPFFFFALFLGCINAHMPIRQTIYVWL